MGKRRRDLLTGTEVAEIKRLKDKYKLSDAVLGLRFSVSSETIRRALGRKAKTVTKPRTPKWWGV